MGKRKSARVASKTTHADESTPKASQLNRSTREHSVPGKQTNDDDSKYEFNAPKFHDFANPDKSDDVNVDQWFDDRLPTPYVPKVKGKHNDVAAAAEHSDVLAALSDDLTRPTRKSTRSSAKVAETTEMFQPVIAKRPKQGALDDVQPNKKTTTKDDHEEEEETFTVQTVVDKAKGKARTASAETITKRTTAKPTQPNLHTMSLRARMPLLSAATSKSAVKKPAAPTKRPGLTIPEPFHFHASLKEHGNDVSATKVPKSPFVPLAQKVKKFEAKTPDRFKVKPTKKAATKSHSPKLTHPKSPHLKTKLRARPKYIPSRDELEQAALAAIPAFKARPVDPKVVAGAFKAPPVKRQQLTIPRSPAITKRKAPEPDAPLPSRIVKANPIPDFSKAFEPVREHRVIMPADNYHLPGEEISQRKRAEFETSLRQQQEEEERQRQFMAQPLPDEVMGGSSLHHHPERPLTQPHPFHFHTDERGALHQQTFQNMIQKESEEKENASRFKAHPIPDLSTQFVPKKSTKPLTEPEEVELHTMTRAEERKVFEDELKKKEEMEEILRREMAEKEQREEEQQVKEVRQQLVHRAQPIRHYTGIQIRPSDKKLTEPTSPAIGEKRRAARSEGIAARKGMMKRSAK
ncbi:hypothetical protein SmJEL517_g06255 [Synchytrium microbalum]|uniref:TPX2 C-terminal domain-containing protein n=1 Tax=Synchytrium microbalum TaxID=1806994 RepID=A0A507BWF0_9FUNG|nr:uncharacterized protein SmJEL517_g06255 [Synchytrium microbalum]TPX30106.1 hypothetical protein SmJEL517_g06255 [Synchytrium microbalum]